jgi:hypothetical protein
VARIPQSGLAVGGRLMAVPERVQRRRVPLRKEIHGILREAGRSQRTRTTTEGHGAAGGHRQETGPVAGERMRRAEPPITGVAGQAEISGTGFFSDRLHGFFDVRKGTSYFTYHGYM